MTTACRGAVGCAGELAQGLSPWKERGYDAPYVNFCLKMVATLQAANVTPVVRRWALGAVARHGVAIGQGPDTVLLIC